MSKIKLVINNTNQQREKEKFFIKKELQSILNLYAKMVSNIAANFVIVIVSYCILYRQNALSLP